MVLSQATALLLLTILSCVAVKATLFVYSITLSFALSAVALKIFRRLLLFAEQAAVNCAEQAVPCAEQAVPCAGQASLCAG